MAKKTLNMIEKMMGPNVIDYYIINCAIPSIITIAIKNRYQIGFGKPGCIIAGMFSASIYIQNLSNLVCVLLWL